MPEWPNDADGDALRRIWNDGADFTVKHVVDFQVDFDNPNQIADARKLLEQKYHKVALYDEPDGPYLQISKLMLLQYNALLREQDELSDLTAKFGGKCEAWGVLIE